MRGNMQCGNVGKNCRRRNLTRRCAVLAASYLIATASSTPCSTFPISPSITVKCAADRPYADPEQAARKLLELANAVEPAQDGRIHIEKINEPFCIRRAAALPNTRRALN